MIEKELRRPLWKCPQCGHRFVTRKIWHSCGRYDLESHFRGKSPRAKKLFREFMKRVRSLGPVNMYPQKTRIVVMDRVRFAATVIRKDWIELSFYFTRRHESPRFHRVLAAGPRAFAHYLRIRETKEFDAEFERWLREAYRIGRQRHLLSRR